VQTIKHALAKMVGLKTDSCDDLLPYTVLGYNTSVQTSTGFSPSSYMPFDPPFQHRLTLHPRVGPLGPKPGRGFRARAIPASPTRTAGNNIAIAQHRDQLRYARTPGGS
jgi:hypothetical protein